MPIKILTLFLILTLSLSACKRNEFDDSDKVKVAGAAKEILEQAGALHLFSVDTFIFIPKTAIRNDVMQLHFDSFQPSASDEEPEKDEVITLNWLAYQQDRWDENDRQWRPHTTPLLDYKDLSSYRLFADGQLGDPVSNIKNHPIYKTIDDNIFEQQLAVQFVWDFSAYGAIKKERSLTGDRLDKYETLYGYPLLPHVNTWSNIRINGGRPIFSTDATVFAASRSVARDVYVVEATWQGSKFSLDDTRFNNSAPSLSNALSLYPIGGARLEYRFTVDYNQHHVVYLNIDLANNLVEFYSTPTGGTKIADASLIIHSAESYAEINTEAMDNAKRAALNIPSYFNPIFVGPFGGEYFYGKHYIKTNEFNRLLLPPMFFLNSAAKQDIQSTFKTWREEEYNDRYDR